MHKSSSNLLQKSINIDFRVVFQICRFSEGARRADLGRCAYTGERNMLGFGDPCRGSDAARLDFGAGRASREPSDAPVVNAPACDGATSEMAHVRA
jgi:hypothetical protein